MEFEARDGRLFRGTVREDSPAGLFVLSDQHLYYISKNPSHASYVPARVVS